MQNPECLTERDISRWQVPQFGRSEFRVVIAVDAETALIPNVSAVLLFGWGYGSATGAGLWDV